MKVRGLRLIPHLNFVGIESSVGKNIGLFLKLGLGVEGIISSGISGRF